MSASFRGLDPGPGGSRVRRRPVAPIEWIGLDERAKAALSTWPSIVEDYPDDLAERVIAAPEHSFADLRHPLSDHFLAFNPRRALNPRSAGEAQAARQIGAARFAADIRSPARFERMLVELNAGCVGATAGLRTTEVGLDPDRQGTVILFPPPPTIAGQLERLRLHLCRNLAQHPQMCAMQSIVSITNIHPFADGNGRLARIFFNLSLRAGFGGRLAYIPLCELFYRSSGGYQIALRQAELHGDWTAFGDFLTRTLEAGRSIARREPAASSSFSATGCSA